MSTEDDYVAVEVAEGKPGQGGEQLEFADSSGPLFNMYLVDADRADRKKFERWHKDTEGVILFSTLFSAAVAVLVAVTFPDLNGNTQERSAFFLENIYQLLADPNASRPLTPVEPPTSHPGYLIWVNSLWFLSLAISLTYAMVATLLRQWLSRYLDIIESPPDSPHDRARRRAFFARGVDSFHFVLCLKALPALLHLSFFVFFAGLLILSFNVNHPVFFVIVWWVGLSGVAYLLITIMPFFRIDSPYFTPLSSIYGLLQRAEKEARNVIEDPALKIDGWIIEWMLDNVSEDRRLRQFFDTVPGFCRSKVVENPQGSLGGEFPRALSAFAQRTWAYDVFPQWEKLERLVSCVKAADAAHLSEATLEILKGMFPLGRNNVLQDEEMGGSLRKVDNESNTEIGLCAQSIIAGIIATTADSHSRDMYGSTWSALATDQLGEDLQAYVNHGTESVLLANLVHITSQIFDSSLGDNRNMARAASYILPSLSNLDIQNTLPVLQHDFLALWNKISYAENDDDIAKKISDGLRHLYDALGQGPGAPPTEPYVSTAEPGGQSAPTTGGPGPGSTSSIASASVSNRDPPSPGLHVV